MAVNISSALAAYAKRAPGIGAGAGAEGVAPRSADPVKSFAEMLDEAANNAIATGREGEAMSAKAIAGKAELNQVVTAVTNAEVTLQTVLAVRDRLVQAYQDILRMPI